MQNAFSEVTRKKLKPEGVPSKFKLDDSGNFYNDSCKTVVLSADILDAADVRTVAMKHHALEISEDDNEKMLDATATVNNIQNFTNEDKENMLRGASGIPENSLNVCQELLIFEKMVLNKQIINLPGKSWDMMVKHEPENLIIFHQLLRRHNYKKAIDIISLQCVAVSENRWKHIKCEKLSKTGKACSKCVSLFKLFDQQALRMNKNQNTGKLGVLIRKNAEMLKKTVKLQSQSIKRLENKVDILKKQLMSVHENFKNLSEMKVHEQLVNLPEQ